MYDISRHILHLFSYLNLTHIHHFMVYMTSKSSKFSTLDTNELQIGFLNPRLRCCDVYSMCRWSTNRFPQLFDIRSCRDPSQGRPRRSQQPYETRPSVLVRLENVERSNGTGASGIEKPEAEW